MIREFYSSWRLYFLMSCLFVACTTQAQAPVTLATLDNPTLFAVDATGNLFAQTVSGDFMDFMNPPTYGIAKINPSGAVTSVINPLTTQFGVSSIAMDFNGNFYTREATGDVNKIAPNGTITPVNIVDAMKIVCDSQGNLLVLQYYSQDNYMLKKITPSGTVSTVIGPGIINTSDNLCVDANGNVYVVKRNKTTDVDSILKISADGNYTVLAGNGILQYLPNITCDAAGNLYVVTTANFVDYSIGKLSVQGNYTTLFTNIAPPSAIVVDAAGAVFLSYKPFMQPGTILKFTAAGCTPTTTTEIVTAFGSYTWNGTVYTATGVYTGTTTNCVTQKLDLTIVVAKTQLRQIQCGKTMLFITDAIQASPLVGATEYTFEVTRVDNNAVYTIVSPRYYFFPAAFIPNGLVWGNSYSIKVKAKIGSNYTAYGNTCIVTAPAEPAQSTLTKIRSLQCGKTMNYITDAIQASPVYLATQYEFNVTNGVTTIVIPSKNYYFRLSQFPGGGVLNTAYTITVRSKGTATAFTAYGAACVVRTPTARMSDVSTNDIFEVKAFPNPFASHFSVDIESSSDAPVEMKVYDMLGRTLEVRMATASELSVLKVGHNYPSGVYNILVRQGENVKSLRMMKR